MSDCEIVRAQESDIDGICDLINAIGVTEGDHIADYNDSFWNDRARGFFTDALTNEKVLSIVARLDGTVIGCGAAIMCDDDPQCYLIRGDYFGYIRYMRTAQEHRNQGIGKAILDELMKWFDENNVDDIQLHSSEKSLEFYEKHGFKIGVGIEMWRDKSQLKASS